MPVLAMSSGKVTAIWGQAYLRLPDGGLQVLHVGDKVPGGAQVVTDEGGMIEISPLKGPSVLLDAAPAPVPAPVVVEKTLANVEAADVQLAPAAGLDGGFQEGGLSPGLRVERVHDDLAGPGLFSFPETPEGLGQHEALGPLVDTRPLAGALSLGDSAHVPVPAPAPTPQEPVIAVDERPYMLVLEGEPAVEGQPVVFHLVLTHASTSPVTVALQVASGTGADAAALGMRALDTIEQQDAQGNWHPVTGTVTFDPGQTDMHVRVPTIDDAQAQGTEYIRLDATVLAGTTANTHSGNETAILDNDLPYMLVLDGEPATEGSPVVFHLTLTGPSDEAVTVALSVHSGSNVDAATAGVDTTGAIEQRDADGNWHPISGNVTFEPGTTDIYVRVATVDDSQPESTEYIRLEADVISGQTANTHAANESPILDNDTPSSQTPAAAAEPLLLQDLLQDPAGKSGDPHVVSEAARHAEMHLDHVWSLKLPDPGHPLHIYD